MTEVSTRDVHLTISEEAAWIANRMMVNDPRIPAQFVNVFGPSHYSLGVEFDRGMVQLGQEVVDALREIGGLAMKEALTVHRDLFVGLILGEARQGRNYFDQHHDLANR